MSGWGASMPVLLSLAAVLIVLALTSLAAWYLTMTRSDRDFTELNQRIRSWWVMVLLFAIAILVSGNVALVFFALVSFLALKEYFSIIPTRRADRSILFWAYLAIPVQYYWIGIDWYGLFIIFIPVYMFLFLPMRMVLLGETRNFLQAAGTLNWGLMLTVFCISHIAYLLMTPEADNPGVGG
ncbi:MAG: phosphatidate cytidylyltransferase, partial [Salinisphaera sp.]|nr:phosphatidate cytidylyltransferase [Salinisphaera sp.]